MLIKIFEILASLNGKYDKDLFDEMMQDKTVTISQFIVYVGQYEVAKSIDSNVLPSMVINVLSSINSKQPEYSSAQPAPCGGCGGGTVR